MPPCGEQPKPDRARCCVHRWSTPPSAMRSARAGPVLGLDVDHLGRIDPDTVSDALERARTLYDQAVSLVHCQWANHEVGTVQPVAAVIDRCRQIRTPVLVHVDAVAAAGHVPCDLGALDADLVSVSAHKLGGPPGIGARRWCAGAFGSIRSWSAVSRNGPDGPGSRTSPPPWGSRRPSPRWPAPALLTPRRSRPVDSPVRSGKQPWPFPGSPSTETQSTEFPTSCAWESRVWRRNPSCSAWTKPASPLTRARRARPSPSSRRPCSRPWASTPTGHFVCRWGGLPPTPTSKPSPRRSLASSPACGRSAPDPRHASAGRRGGVGLEQERRCQAAGTFEGRATPAWV